MKSVLLFAIFIAAFVYACGPGDEKAEGGDTAKVCVKKPLNPNGDSELAILMREMANWTDSCKAAIESGREIPSKPEHLGDLHSAKRTDETIDASLFNSLASLYQGKVMEFEQCAEKERVEYHNAMVGACVGCHQNFCQGPLVRINKMLISE